MRSTSPLSTRLSAVTSDPWLVLDSGAEGRAPGSTYLDDIQHVVQVDHGDREAHVVRPADDEIDQIGLREDDGAEDEVVVLPGIPDEDESTDGPQRDKEDCFAPGQSFWGARFPSPPDARCRRDGYQPAVAVRMTAVMMRASCLC